jgi:hypothetical protein
VYGSGPISSVRCQSTRPVLHRDILTGRIHPFPERVLQKSSLSTFIPDL